MTVFQLCFRLMEILLNMLKKWTFHQLQSKQTRKLSAQFRNITCLVCYQNDLLFFV